MSETTRHAGRILIIEDDPDARANLRAILELDDYAIEQADSIAEALEHPALEAVEVILVDRKLPDDHVLDSLIELRGKTPGAALVIITAYADLQGAIEAIRHGAADYILKPVNPDSLRVRIGRLVHQRRLAQAKERSEAVFRGLMETAELMVAIIRPEDHAILYFSPPAERLSGYLAQEVQGASFVERIVCQTDQAAFVASCQEAVDGASQRQTEGRIRRRDGSILRTLRTIRYLPDYDGAPALLIIGQDISELKQAQERALNSERLAAIGQMCAGLAHESRNALQRSQACLEMLDLRLRDRPDLKNLIDRIQQAQDDLHRLYEDVREYAAPIRLSIGDCDLADVWRRAWCHLERQYAGKRVVFSERQDGVDLNCQGDAFRLEQVFRNILDNSLAACAELPETLIQVAAEPAAIEGRDAVRIAFRDNGPGLTAEQEEKLFDAFYTTKTHGTGLGMPIVRRIIEAHGGRAGVGQRNRGAEIILTLPRRQGR